MIFFLPVRYKWIGRFFIETPCHRYDPAQEVNSAEYHRGLGAWMGLALKAPIGTLSLGELRTRGQAERQTGFPFVWNFCIARSYVFVPKDPLYCFPASVEDTASMGGDSVTHPSIWGIILG